MFKEVNLNNCILKKYWSYVVKNLLFKTVINFLMFTNIYVVV